MTQLINEISKMSINERILLVQEILSTITQDEKGIPHNLSDTQQEEIRHRSQAIKDGKAKTFQWETVEKELKDRYAL
jgi:putative addiction module component (TIGR02574 family)